MSMCEKSSYEGSNHVLTCDPSIVSFRLGSSRSQERKPFKPKSQNDIINFAIIVRTTIKVLSVDWKSLHISFYPQMRQTNTSPPSKAWEVNSPNSDFRALTFEERLITLLRPEQDTPRRCWIWLRGQIWGFASATSTMETILSRKIGGVHKPKRARYADLYEVSSETNETAASISESVLLRYKDLWTRNRLEMRFSGSMTFGRMFVITYDSAAQNYRIKSKQ